MLRHIVDFSLENRPLVLIAAVLVVLGGGYALTQLPIDVQPDITNVQVQVLTKAPALGPVEMEQFVTYPIEAAMNGLPRLREIRSISRYGLSAVTVVFEDGVDVYFARQLVNERLTQARDGHPARDRHPGDGAGHDRPRRRLQVHGRGRRRLSDGTPHDPRLADRPSAAGGARRHRGERVGCLPKQYQVVVDPARLLASGSRSMTCSRRWRRDAQRRRGIHRAQP